MNRSQISFRIRLRNRNGCWRLLILDDIACFLVMYRLILRLSLLLQYVLHDILETLVKRTLRVFYNRVIHKGARFASVSRSLIQTKFFKKKKNFSRSCHSSSPNQTNPSVEINCPHRCKHNEKQGYRSE